MTRRGGGRSSVPYGIGWVTTRSPPGRVHSRPPSASRRIVQPGAWWLSRWWCRQRQQRLLAEVGPAGHGTTWSRSQRSGARDSRGTGSAGRGHGRSGPAVPTVGSDRWPAAARARDRAGMGARSTAATTGASVAGRDPAHLEGVGQRQQFSGDLVDDRDVRQGRQWSARRRPDAQQCGEIGRRLLAAADGSRLGSATPAAARGRSGRGCLVERPRPRWVGRDRAAAADRGRTPSRGSGARTPDRRRSRRARRRR